MRRLGAQPTAMKHMDKDEIFYSRLQLLIIMASAYLEGYPLGDFRKKAVAENAQYVAKESVDWGGYVANFRSSHTSQKGMDFDHVFFERVKLLAVMAKAFAEGNPMGHTRQKALQENVAYISETLTFPNHMNEVAFLKVA